MDRYWSQNTVKKTYKPEEVKEAYKKSTWFAPLDIAIDFSCWAMSTFSSRTDFESYHQKTGEICDYVAMKSEMLNGLSTSSDTAWTTIPDVVIDTSWLDYGEIFDGLFEGIGNFMSALFDGI